MRPTCLPTLPGVRCATLVAWARAWRAGLVSYDDVVDEVSAAGEDHVMAGLDGTVTPLRGGLAGLSDTPEEALRVVLPASGDPRGLPPGALAAAALEAGEAAVCGGHGLVPVAASHASGSGDAWTVVTWTAFPAASSVDPLTLPEAEHDLLETMRVAGSSLRRLDLTGSSPEARNAVGELRRGRYGTHLPPGYPARAARVLERAETVARMLALAGADTPPAVVTARDAADRSAALRPLATAARRARMAAVNAPLERAG